MHPYIHILGRAIPSYGVMMMLGVLVAGAISLNRVHRQGYRWEETLVLGVCGLASGLLGASLLYLFVTYPLKELLRLVSTGALFTEAKTGLVFYGGLLGSIPGVLIGRWITGAKVSVHLRAVLPTIPLAHAFGRVGCFLAGCCYGAPTELPIGIAYTAPLSAAPVGVPLLPVQLMESVALLLISLILHLAGRRLQTVRLAGLYAVLYGLCRFTLEFFRYDSIRGAWLGVSTSQWISMGMVLSGALLLIFPRTKRA